MSEPDISTLARRLAEQNNVDWRSLNGSGPDGKVVERDVLDYLSRVMSGSEALDPTPEPLPEGMEAWPEQDLAAFRQGVGEGASSLDALRDEIASSAKSTSSGSEAQEPIVETVAFGRRQPDAETAPPQSADESSLAGDGASFGDAGLGDEAGAAEELLGEDIFLFDDDAPPAVTVPAVAEAIDPVDELDDLLVAGDDDAFEDAAVVADGHDDDSLAAGGFEPDGGLGGFETLEDQVEEFVIGATSQAQDDFADLGVTGLSSSSYDSDDDLPDLFGEAAPADTDEPASDAIFASSDGEAAIFSADEPLATGAYGAAAAYDDDADEPGTVDEFRFDSAWTSDSASGAVAAQEPTWPGLDEVAAEPGVAADAGQEDAVETREIAAPAVFAAGALPLARPASLLRRNVDLSSLASAQLAVSLELGNAEPLNVAPFLLRAVAKAAVETGLPPGPIALADLSGGVRLRRVDDAASRSFASLVGLLEDPFEEEDEPVLAVADLGPLDLDEVILDLDVPVVSLGRVLYDTQRGGYRSTLALSGSLAPDSGARLLARVAELLDAPVRLVL